MDATVTVEQAVEFGFQHKPAEWINSPKWDLTEALGWWWFQAVYDGTYGSHDTDRHECNGAPYCDRSEAWEKDLEALYSSTVAAIQSEAIELVQRRIREALSAFAEAHPEAVRRLTVDPQLRPETSGTLR